MIRRLLLSAALATLAFSPSAFSQSTPITGNVPGGSSTQVQYNNGGAFGGISGATTDGTALTLVAPVLGAATGTSLALTGASANILTAGLNGTTNPAFNVDASTALSATGLKVKSAAATGGLALSVLSSGSNENLTINALGSGTIGIGTASTGAITLTRATTMSAALTYGGVTLSNGVTGTGNMVLDTSPTLVTPSLGVTTITGTGAGSVAGTLWTGLPFAGTGTTSFPLLFVQPTGGTPPTASTAWSTSGTVIGANLHTGTFGNFLDFQVDGTSKASIVSSGAINGVSLTATGGNVQVTAGAALLWNGRGILSSPAAAKVQIGSTDAASPVAQTLLFQNVIAGTSNTAGVNGTFAASAGTGTGAGGSMLFQTAPAGSTGTAQNAEQTALTIDQKSHIGLSSAAIPTIGTCGTGSPTVTAGSTDNAGEFTVGTTATACTLTFKQTFAAAPFCVLSDKTAMVNLLSYTISTSALVLTMTSNSGNVVEYHCSGI